MIGRWRAAELRNRPQQRRSQKTVERIIEAADRVFGEVGIDKTTTVAIADRAGVSVGSLYHFFPDKHAIADAVIERHREDTAADLARILSDARSLADAPEVVRTMVRAAAERQLEHPAYYALSAVERPGEEDSATHSVREAILSLGVGALEHNGASLDEEDAHLLVNFITESIRHFLHVAPTQEPARSRYLTELERMVVAYLRSRLWGEADAL